MEEAQAHESALQHSLDAQLSVLDRQARAAGRPSTAPMALQTFAAPEPEPESFDEDAGSSSGAGVFASGNATDENVIVVCRVRPESGAERSQAAAQPLLQYGHDGRSLTMHSPDGGAAHSFGFRRVFGSLSRSLSLSLSLSQSYLSQADS